MRMANYQDYSPRDWNNGDFIEEQDLDKIETGIKSLETYAKETQQLTEKENGDLEYHFTFVQY